MEIIRCNKAMPAMRCGNLGNFGDSLEKGEVKFTGTPADVRANEGELQKYTVIPISPTVVALNRFGFFGVL